MELKRCANCANGRWTSRESQVPEICITCNYNAQGDPSAWEPIAVTNADRIRAMGDEELANFICKAYECYRCPGEELCNAIDGKANGAMKWLQQPAEVDNV